MIIHSVDFESTMEPFSDGTTSGKLTLILRDEGGQKFEFVTHGAWNRIKDGRIQN